MKAYKFIFFLATVNILVPFFGIPTVYKQYTFVTLGVGALLYALYMRTILKEHEEGLSRAYEAASKDSFVAVEKTIEEVVVMSDVRPKVIVSDVQPKRRGRKPKVVVEEVYE